MLKTKLSKSAATPITSPFFFFYSWLLEEKVRRKEDTGDNGKGDKRERRGKDGKEGKGEVRTKRRNKKEKREKIN